MIDSVGLPDMSGGAPSLTWQVRNDPIGALKYRPRLAAEFDAWAAEGVPGETFGDQLRNAQAKALEILVAHGVVKPKAAS